MAGNREEKMAESKESTGQVVKDMVSREEKYLTFIVASEDYGIGI
jgi:hypothetical protein